MISLRLAACRIVNTRRLAREGLPVPGLVDHVGRDYTTARTEATERIASST